MGASPIESVQIERQRGDEGFALAGLHLGDAAFVQDDAADQLHIVLAQSDSADGGFAHEGECLNQDVFVAGAIGQLRLEVGGLCFHLLIA